MDARLKVNLAKYAGGENKETDGQTGRWMDRWIDGQMEERERDLSSHNLSDYLCVYLFISMYFYLSIYLFSGQQNE